jgi:integration host factor subunit beta
MKYLFMSSRNFSHLLWLKGVNLETGAQLTMTKAELVEEVTQLGDLTRRDGEVIVDTIFDAVVGALKSGDKIEIRGFGSFRIRQRKPRIGRNPKTGAKVEVPAKRVPYFKPSKELRDLVNPHEAEGTRSAIPAE